MLGIASREELYHRISVEAHIEWVDYYNSTMYAPDGVRAGLANVAAAVLNSQRSSKEDKLFTVQDMAVPALRKEKEPERGRERGLSGGALALLMRQTKEA